MIFHQCEPAGQKAIAEGQDGGAHCRLNINAVLFFAFLIRETLQPRRGNTFPSEQNRASGICRSPGDRPDLNGLIVNTYEIRIIRKDVNSAAIYSSSHVSDYAAVRRARNLAASGDSIEVWRGADCVYSRGSGNDPIDGGNPQIWRDMSGP